jgi:hypothetical protein
MSMLLIALALSHLSESFGFGQVPGCYRNYSGMAAMAKIIIGMFLSQLFVMLNLRDSLLPGRSEYSTSGWYVSSTFATRVIPSHLTQRRLPDALAHEPLGYEYCRAATFSPGCVTATPTTSTRGT